MQRYNEPAENYLSDSDEIEFNDSNESDNEQPQRVLLRQPTLINSPSMNDSAPLSRDEDIAQLENAGSVLRAFIREVYTLDDAATEIRNLNGHQDLKDMIPENMGYIDTLRRLADMLELIQNKLDDLRAQNELEQVAANETMSPVSLEYESGGYGTTDTEPESESELDSDQDDLYVTPPRSVPEIAYDSDDESDGGGDAFRNAGSGIYGSMPPDIFDSNIITYDSDDESDLDGDAFRNADSGGQQPPPVSPIHNVSSSDSEIELSLSSDEDDGVSTTLRF